MCGPDDYRVVLVLAREGGLESYLLGGSLFLLLTGTKDPIGFSELSRSIDHSHKQLNSMNSKVFVAQK